MIFAGWRCRYVTSIVQTHFLVPERSPAGSEAVNSEVHSSRERSTQSSDPLLSQSFRRVESWSNNRFMTMMVKFSTVWDVTLK